MPKVKLLAIHLFCPISFDFLTLTGGMVAGMRLVAWSTTSSFSAVCFFSLKKAVVHPNGSFTLKGAGASNHPPMMENHKSKGREHKMIKVHGGARTTRA
uniref:Secreted protein n=1 Tax=Pyxicephalus adspersus TaxID=30357 RepID=A0AAV2ZZY1_PYXAD|nr:TPA: hypothetical protein GDO54_002488 [Pyxicephalus adspersus]